MNASRESRIRGLLSPGEHEATGMNVSHLFIFWGELRSSNTEASPSMQEA